MENPYSAPRSNIAGGEGVVGGDKVSGWRVDKVRFGQRLLIAVIFAHVLAVGSLVVAPSLGLSDSLGMMLVLLVMFVELACIVAAIVGLLKISSGLEFSYGARFFILLAMLFPLINLITLLVINGKATEFLKRAGYEVGLLGAK